MPGGQIDRGGHSSLSFPPATLSFWSQTLQVTFWADEAPFKGPQPVRCLWNCGVTKTLLSSRMSQDTVEITDTNLHSAFVRTHFLLQGSSIEKANIIGLS